MARLLIISHAYFPSVGGIETTARLLAKRFQILGHDVVLASATESPGREETEDDFMIVRAPSSLKVWRLVHSSDAVLFMNTSVRLGWPAFLSRKSLTTVVQTWPWSRSRPSSLAELGRWIFLLRSRRLVVSSAVGKRLKLSNTVVPNPFDGVFLDEEVTAPRNFDIGFVGRLVKDKGVQLLLEAIRNLESRDSLRIVVVGDGPESAPLRQFAVAEGINVLFLGSLSAVDTARVLRSVRVLAVPSVWEEPFGIVALEGLASGCVVVASDGGGLPEAVGDCGFLFRRNDNASLTKTLKIALASQLDQAKVLRHLAQFDADRIAQRYLEAMFARS